MTWERLIESHPLLGLLLFVIVGPPALMSKAGAKLPGFLGWAGRKWQARAELSPEERRSSTSYRVAEAEIARLAADYERLSQDYAEMAAENEEWDRRFARLEGEFTKEKRIRWAAIGYIRQLIDALRKYAPDADVPPPPQALADIL